MASMDKTRPKRIFHLSDLHFGRIHTPALEALRQTVAEQDQGFDLIVVTGDWTQRARSREFEEAIEFVKRLFCPVLSVPGNHDVPLYDLGRRFFAPYSRYAKLRPLTLGEYSDDLFSIVGLSTVNPFRCPILSSADTRTHSGSRSSSTTVDRSSTFLLEQERRVECVNRSIAFTF